MEMGRVAFKLPSPGVGGVHDRGVGSVLPSRERFRCGFGGTEVDGDEDSYHRLVYVVLSSASGVRKNNIFARYAGAGGAA